MELRLTDTEIKLLREKIDLLVRRIFGRSSEAMDDAQLMLLYNRHAKRRGIAVAT